MPLFLLRLALVVGALLCIPQAARAHAILLDSSPAAGARVAAGKITLSLRYNSRIDAGRSRVTLAAPGGGPARTLAIAAGATPDTLTAEVTLAPGRYVVHWQVLAIDGHITRGDLAFTAGPGAASP